MYAKRVGGYDLGDFAYGYVYGEGGRSPQNKFLLMASTFACLNA